MAARRPWAFGARPATATPQPSPPPLSSAWLFHRLGRIPPLLIAAALGIIAAPLVLINPQSFGGVSGYLPTAAIDLGYSLSRMALAYGLSVGFAIAYGYYAATNPTGERILLPILDILQSVPILGFFPVVLIAFVALTPGSSLGANLAAIFLIFTCMAWNLAFGVYESLKTIPNDLRETTSAFGVTGRQRWREVLLPATTNRLVYNSVLSWTNGWFFLVSAEIISVGAYSTQLPGIGSFLALNVANTDALIAGLVLLGILIVVLDLFVWRRARTWAERFRYDVAPSGEDASAPATQPGGFRRAARAVTRTVSLGFRGGYSVLRTPVSTLFGARRGPGHAPSHARPQLRVATKYLVLGVGLVLAWLLIIFLIVASYQILTGPIDNTIRQYILQVPEALAFSGIRLLIAFAVCVAIAIPLSIYLARNPRSARAGVPVIEIVASFPATAFFPIVISIVVGLAGAWGASIFILITGSIWYLFFNALAGARGIPPDLEEAARSMGTRGSQYYRKVMLPAMSTAIITGAITAWGAAWNALIVAEYLPNPSDPSGAPLFSVLGLGFLISYGNFHTDGLPLMLIALLTLVVVVVTLNEVVWKPLYRRAISRNRYD